MRFAVPRLDPRLHALVVGLHDDDLPAAETWRRVGETAAELGLPRPSYHTVRVLVRDEEARRQAAAGVRRAALGVAASLLSPRVVALPIALDALELARAKKRLVTERHKPP